MCIKQASGRIRQLAEKNPTGKPEKAVMSPFWAEKQGGTTCF